MRLCKLAVYIDSKKNTKNRIFGISSYIVLEVLSGQNYIKADVYSFGIYDYV
jgi:hypothetical protein